MSKIDAPAHRRFSRRQWRWLAAATAAGLAAAVLASTLSGQFGSATITIDPARTHQAFHGWEATAEAGLDDIAPAPGYIEEVVDAAAELGLTRLRVEVIASAEHSRDLAGDYRAGRMTDAEWRCVRYSTVNDNADPSVINPDGFHFAELDRRIESLALPFARRLASSGGRLWLNVNYVAFTRQLCGAHQYGHDEPEEYAEFVLAVYQHLRDKYGLTPDSWEVMLEPDQTTVWNPELMARAIAAAARRLSAAGFTPSFIAPSTKSARVALQYFDVIWSDPGARPFVTELSYHRYTGASDTVIANIGRVGAERGVATAMLERIGAGMPALYQDLTVGGVSAWQQYVLAYPGADNGGHYLHVTPDAPAGQRVSLSTIGRGLRQYFRALRPGARRVDASSDDAALQPVAARNLDGTPALVFNASRAGEVTVRGLPPGSYSRSCWLQDAGTYVEAPDCSGSLTIGATATAVLRIPAAGIFSVTPQSAEARRGL